MKATNKLVMTIACAIVSGFGMPTAHANCPTLEGGITAKYVAVYMQSPDNIGTSWRLYIRPRNSSCLYADQDYQSPKGAPHATARVKPGDQNCNDNYKSYISLYIPPASEIWGTFSAQSKPTTIGVDLKGTKNSGGNKMGIAVQPMQNSDGSYSQTEVKVVGMCFE